MKTKQPFFARRKSLNNRARRVRDAFTDPETRRDIWGSFVAGRCGLDHHKDLWRQLPDPERKPRPPRELRAIRLAVRIGKAQSL